MLSSYWILALLPGLFADEVCLLTLNARSNRAGVQQLVDEHRALKEWASQHAKKRAALMEVVRQDGGTPGLSMNVEEFIRRQGASSDSCHAKILEVRRTLDGILSKVTALSDEMEGSEAIIEGNTVVIKEAVDNKADNDAQRDAAIAACDKAHEEAVADLQQYLDELAELDQIAEPSVRSKIAMDLDYKHEVDKHMRSLDLGSGTALLSESANCSKLVAFLARKQMARVSNVTDASNAAPTYAALDCNATRAVLQQEFTKSYTEIHKLHEDGAKLAADELEECKDEAATEHSVRQSQLDGKIHDASANINAAKDTLQELTPLLNNAKEEAEALQAHIDELKKSCQIEGDVTEHLVKIRQLIHSLEECPGRNDFKLTVPPTPTR